MHPLMGLATLVLAAVAISVALRSSPKDAPAAAGLPSPPSTTTTAFPAPPHEPRAVSPTGPVGASGLELGGVIADVWKRREPSQGAVVVCDIGGASSVGDGGGAIAIALYVFLCDGGPSDAYAERVAANVRVATYSNCTQGMLALHTVRRPQLTCDIVAHSASGGRAQAMRELRVAKTLARRDSTTAYVTAGADAPPAIQAAVRHFEATGVLLRDGSGAAHHRIANSARFRSAEFDAVLSGGWAAIDLSAYDELSRKVTEHFLSLPKERRREGHSGQLLYERMVYVALASMPSVRTICEIGFNMGHSAALWLKANPNASVHMFDILAHDYAMAQFNYIRSHGEDLGLHRAAERLVLHPGDSARTIMRMHREDPSFRCDLMSVDGGHSKTQAMLDMSSMKRFANRQFHVALIDDTNTNIPLYIAEIDGAVDAHMDTGRINVLDRFAERWGNSAAFRGVSVFQYNL